MPDFLEVLKTRRSIRQYKPRTIPKEIILEMLDLCRYAANAHNSQPFRFIVILNTDLKKRLINAMTARYELDLRRDGVSKTTIQKIITHSKTRFLKAPVLIVACLTMEDMDHYPDQERQRCEFIMGVQSVANTLQNLLLIAHARGFGACWYCAPLFAPDTVKEVLNLPSSYLPQAFITLGIPDEIPSPITRKPLEDLVKILE
ncbi:MAG: nitroreductase family protein [Candidatus Helarchaeota archaeon]